MYDLTNEIPLFVIPSLAMYFNEKGATIFVNNSIAILQKRTL